MYEPYTPCAGHTFSARNMKYNFFEVLPDDIHYHWKTILPDLDRALEHSPEKNICNGDIYVALKNGDARLCVVETYDGDYVGFFITEDRIVFGEKQVNIWILASRNHGDFREICKAVLNTAVRNKCSRIVCSTARKGLGRLLENFGMKQQSVSYSMEV